ncbi:MAG: GNAT family N-acetyltransferase [Halioglobus sp.]
MASNINYNVSLLSKRLRLPPVMGAHAEAMYTVLSDDSLYKYTGGSPPQSVVDVEKWFSALESRKSTDGHELWLTWLIFTVEGDRAIGYIQATVENSKADIAWLVGSKWQGNGYASEAAATLSAWLAASDIDRISAHIHPNHIASKLVASAAGLHSSGQMEDDEEVWQN